MKNPKIVIARCVDCPHAKVEVTPDPDDWFCDDDERITCVKAHGKILGSMLRPYETTKITPPDWCPLR